jgi:hypothetical protein
MTGKLVLTVMLISLVCSLASTRPVFCLTSDTKIGLFYYVWYGEYNEQSKTGRHWNDSQAHTVVDEPILGFYSSQNVSVIEQHLEWFKELGINFLIASWWGPNSYEDNSTKTIFSIVKENEYPIEIAIMVEAFNSSGLYDFKKIYDYINETYVVPYGGIYMRLDSLPLVCFFNDNTNMTSTEEKQSAIRSFTGYSARIVGQTDPYVDWWAWPMSGQNEAPEPRLSRDGYVGLLPRYDDSRLNYSTTTIYDANYTEGLYDKQWNETLRLERSDEVKYLAIYSWNEYPERSQIEPHINSTGSHILLPFTKTYHYIQIIPEFPSFLILPLFMIATLLAIIVYKKS